MVTAPPRQTLSGASSWWIVKTAMTPCSPGYQGVRPVVIIATRRRAVQQSCLLKIRQFQQNGGVLPACGPSAPGTPTTPNPREVADGRTQASRPGRLAGDPG